MIDNTESKIKLHYGKRFLGNTLITPLPVTVNRGETGFIKFGSVIKKAFGMIITKLTTSMRESIIGKNKWFVFIGCKTDPDFPNERSINEYLDPIRNL
ncbi:539_t:CDS:2, partial [Rhizophagus irregularis]